MRPDRTGADGGRLRFAYSTSITPRSTDIVLLKSVLAVQHGTMEPEQFEDLTGEPELPDDLSDAERATLRAHDACDVLLDDPPRAREIAEEALALDPACPDALVIMWSLEDEASDEALRLAREARQSAEDRLEQMKHWRRGVDDVWQQDPGCRGLVRAHGALAQTLWARGEHYEAIGMAEQVLAINPKDNLGMRWKLVNWYLIEDAVGKAYRLLREYPDEEVGPALSAAALVEFLRSGAGKKAGKALRKLVEHNSALFLAFTRDEQTPPWSMEVDMFVPGELTEVLAWEDLLYDAWKAHPSAMAWARALTREPRYTDLALRAAADTIKQTMRLQGISGMDADDIDLPRS